MEHRIQYLKNFFQATFLPIHYYIDNDCYLTLPEIEPSWDLTQAFFVPLLQKEKEVCFMISKEFLYYGMVRNFHTKEILLVGPIANIPLDKKNIEHILVESFVSSEYYEEAWNFFEKSPIFYYEQFIHLLALLHREFNGTTIDPTLYFTNEHPNALKNINKEFSLQSYQSKEEQHFHNSYYFEKKLFQYVTDGNVVALQQLSQQHPYRVGKIASNSLRQEQNIFIAHMTLLIRAAITGGLDIESAYQLSDTYIQESEKAISPDAVIRLRNVAMLDITERVAANKIPKGMSIDIYQCIQYISTHINQPISVTDVADSIGKSRSYISRKFKAELGFNISDFIVRKKLEEGKSLLAFTNKSISEISEYLCFSSQSYFQNLFKKQYHITPYEYRKQCQHV